MAKKNDHAEHNPFVESLTISALWRERKAYIQGGLNVSSTLVDIDHHASVYTERTLELFKDLPSSAKDMFVWLCSKVEYGKDYLEITEKRYCAEMGVSRPTFQLARKALYNRVITLRKLRANTYYINPSYFYRGKRIEAYPKNIAIRNKPRMIVVDAEDLQYSAENTPMNVPGMATPEMFGGADVASLGPDRT